MPCICSVQACPTKCKNTNADADQKHMMHCVPISVVVMLHYYAISDHLSGLLVNVAIRNRLIG